MRLPLPRLRLRTLLIAVAVAGLALAAWRRQEDCLARAREFDSLRSTYLNRLASNEPFLHPIDRRRLSFGFACGASSPYAEQALRPAGYSLRKALEQGRKERETWRQAPAQYRAKADQCLRLAARYRHVARFPWLPLPREPGLSPHGDDHQ